MNLILNIGVFMRYSKLNSLPYYYLTGLANATSVDTIILYKAEIRTTSELKDNVEPQRIGVVQNAVQATIEGERIGAELVIWGHILAENEGVDIYMQILTAPGFMDDAVYPHVLPLVDPATDNSINIPTYNSSKIKEETSQQNLGLAAFSLGLYYYLEKQSALLAAKQFDKARELLHSAEISAGKGNLGLIYYYLGKSYQLQGDYKRSQIMLEEAAIHNPEDPAVVLGQLYNHRVMEEKGKMRIAFDKILELTEHRLHEPEAIYDRAFAFEAMNKGNLAWNEYQAILKCNHELSLCESTFFPAYLSAGRILVNLDRLDDAQNIYGQAKVLAKGDTEKEAWLAVDFGYLYEKTGEPKKAIQSYSDAIALKPSLVRPYVHRAKLYEQQGILDAALLDFRKVVELSNNQSHAYATFAEYLYRLGNYTEAINNYYRALRHSPVNKSLLHAYIGRSFAKNGEEELALTEFEAALKAPSLSESYIRSIYANVLHQFGHMDEAIEQMEQSLVIDIETDVETTLNLGQLYETTGEIDRAIALYESLLAWNEKIPESRIEIIWKRLDRLRSEPSQYLNR